jgi:hypothetical protein
VSELIGILLCSTGKGNSYIKVEELQLPVLDFTASFIGLDGSQDSDGLWAGW